MTRTIVLTGARGGQGTSTVAAALAVFAAGHGPTLLRSNDPATTAALVGIPLPLGDEWVDVCPNLTLVPRTLDSAGTAAYGTVVVDAGRTASRPPEDARTPDSDLSAAATGPVEHYAVLRGPCYVALTTLVTSGVRYDGIIVIEEPGRALSERDVTDVLGLPVVAKIPVDPAIARMIDAGLLLTRLHHHTAPFRALNRLAQPRTGLSKTPIPAGTDLPLSRRDRSGAKTACRARPFRWAVCRAWNPSSGRVGRAEHWEAVAGRSRLLRR